MKRFLIILAFGLATSEKLDRTYLPPPGAHLSGGILGDGDAPLEAPREQRPEVIGGQQNFGNNGSPLNFGDKISKQPVTTTSYAFSQTTSYPVTESFQTTINPVTGLPIIVDQNQANYPYGSGKQNIQNVPVFGNNGQLASDYGTNVQPGFPTQGPSTGPVGFEQVSNLYPGQNTPNGVINIPGSEISAIGQDSIYNADGSNRPFTGQNIAANGNNQLVYPYPGQPIAGQDIAADGNNQVINPYPGQNVAIPGGNQVNQQGFVPSTTSSQVISTKDQPTAQYGVNYDGSQEIIPQGSYFGQPINVPNSDTPQLNQNNINTQQQYPGNQKQLSTPTENYQYGTTPSATPGYYNRVSSTTPTPSIATPAAVYPSSRPVYRPERPQAEADRNAVILNYENVRTPNGYSYSFDTSNGIHADETGIVDNGTKAQGSYSYTGDDGKVYTVYYTADENGFQPRGDHLPTSPPVPEAIQRVIEQAARDKAAGIFDDGSYDETKYGDNKYLLNGNRRRPLNKNKNRLGNKQVNGEDSGSIKPIAGINEPGYTQNLPQNQFESYVKNIDGSDAGGRLPSRRPSNQANIESSNKGKENRFVTEKETPTQFTKDGALYTGDNNDQVNDFENKQGIKVYGKNNTLETTNGPKYFGSKTRDPFAPRTKIDGRKDINTNIPGSQLYSDDAGKYSKTQADKLSEPRKQGIISVNPSSYDQFQETNGNRFENKGPGTIINTVPENANIIPASTQKPIGQAEIIPQNGITSLSDYINKANQAAIKEQKPQKDETGYHYQPPNTKFEQNKFPTRFNPQISSTMEPGQRRTSVSSPKPFITPNVYDQNDRSYQSTTRRPFTTVGVNSPTENSYTDYEDGNDYGTDQDNHDDRNDSKRDPDGNKITSPTYQQTQTTSRPQYIPTGQRTRVTEGTISLGNNVDNSRTGSPTGYVYGPTTPMPSQNSRFGSTETPQRKKTSQPGSSPTIPSTTALGQPVVTGIPAGKGTSDYKYQTTGPIPGYTGSNVVAGYPDTEAILGFREKAPGSNTIQGYPTTTFRPGTGYSTVTPTLGYDQRIVSSTPSTTYSNPSFQTGYSYGPPKVPFLTPTTPGVTVTSTPGYQTTYQPNPGYFSTTPQTPTSGTFVPSQAGNVIPSSSPFGTYQGNYQNGLSQPTTTVSSSPGSNPVLANIGSPSSDFRGYKYGSNRPSPNTGPSSTVGTTPGAFSPTDLPNEFTQSYSTAYRPGIQTTEDSFISGPAVDGFGRPISPAQRDMYPGFGSFNQGLGAPTQGQDSIGVPQGTGLGYRPRDNVGPDNKAQSTAYPGSYDQSKVVGEDFSGPKQPQRFDPKTGYHY